ncbi:TPM domain-containing protein [Corallococcus macrosporus]|uniref:TPM domain-containing protein n=1 Tax=Corallococcus macrosporus TaxID=35 RepID=A0ABS3DQ74_9BACT|nr:TPM domain-containing protein [Corallococcus macrosporus]MBN8233476.1 TPM domain-containing protein [Corallococcus macrosporus]
MVKTVLLTLLFPMLVLAAVPTITRPVTDPRGMLTPQETEVVSRALVDLRARKQVQMAVLLVETTDGQPIEDFAEEVFREWKGGEAGRDNGLLLVIARGDRRSRLEVGYGLESSLTDGETTDLLHAQGPLLRQGRFEPALLAIIAGVREQVSPDALPAPGATPTAWTQSESRMFLMALFMTAWVAARLLLQLQVAGLRDPKNSVLAAMVVLLPAAMFVAIGWSGPRTPVFTFVAYGALVGLFFWGWSLVRRKQTVWGLLLLLLPVWSALVGQFWAHEPLLELSDFFRWIVLGSLLAIPASIPFLFVGLLIYGAVRSQNVLGDWGSSSSSGSSESSSWGWSVGSSSSGSDWSSSSSSDSSSSSSSDWGGGGGSSGGGGGSDSW